MTAPTTTTQGSLSPAQMAAILALVTAQAHIRQQLTQTAVNGATAALRGFGDWWSPTAVDGLVKRLLRIVQPAQLTAARTTDAYFANVSTVMLGRSIRPVGAVNITKLRRDISAQVSRDLVSGRIRPAWIELGNTVDGPSKDINKAFVPRVHPSRPPGRARTHVPYVDEPAGAPAPQQQLWVPPEVPYRRIAEQYRYQVVVEGVPEEKAAKKAAVRVETLIRTDVVLAVREQYHRNMNLPPGQRQQADGWRRVLHPELSQSGPCGLCVVAATRLYKREQLKEIHDLCVCEVLPVYGRMDPGLTLNDDDLRRVLGPLYDAAGGTGGDVIKNGKRHSGALKRVRVVLTEHGELGPVLVNGDQHFRGPAEVAKAKSPDKKVRYRAQLTALEKTHEQMQLRSLMGEDLEKPLRWQSDRIAFLHRELARAG